MKITIDGGSVTPNGARIDVPLGEDVTLDITADAPGELHVHSQPEQEVSYPAGTNQIVLSGLDQPGVVEVEDHDLGIVILQLEVS